MTQSQTPAPTPYNPLAQVRLLDPHPHAYVTPETPGVGGRIKVRPGDFLVEELPKYEPCGTGEHIYLGIEKELVAHSELIGVLRRHFNVSPKAIGFAGMKDKHGITRQTVSIHLHADPPSMELSHDRIRILWSMRHSNKLRRGHLIGNRFSIRIRDVDPFKAPQVQTVLRQLEKTGFPAYFGSQRFGYRANNHVLGAALVRGDYQGILDELLGAGGCGFPDYQRERREHYDAGRYREALAEWTPADQAELIATRALLEGRSPRAACRAIGRTTASFWVSALQSAIFNRVLDRRLESGTFESLSEGDLAWKHDSRAVFPVTAEEMASGLLPPRLEALEVSPSGPLWGSSMTRTSGATDEVELAALEELTMTLDDMSRSPHRPDGARRPLRERISNVEVESGVDDEGPFIRTAFDLPRGVYATVVMRELMKDDG